MLIATPRGFSLVELMVAMALGVVVMSGVISVYMATVRANTDMLKTTRLEEELATAMLYMTRDLRRAGSTPDHLADGANAPRDNPFKSITAIDRSGNGETDCILYTYDYDGDGVIDDGTDSATKGHPDERLGFRFDFDHNAIERRRSGGDCNAPRWEDLTDPRVTRVTDLAFALDTVAKPLPGSNRIETRRLRLSVSGELAGDPSINLKLQSTVRIRNDIVWE